MSSSEAAVRRRAVLCTAPALALAGCGFHLRGDTPLPFRRIALTGFPARSPLAAELTSELQRQVVVETDPAKAELVLQALAEERQRVVVSLTAAAQVRALQLRLRLRWRTHTPAGREVTPLAELALTRDMSYSETQALAKQYEEAELYRDMQSDIVAQVLRRLAVVKL